MNGQWFARVWSNGRWAPVLLADMPSISGDRVKLAEGMGPRIKDLQWVEAHMIPRGNYKLKYLDEVMP